MNLFDEDHPACEEFDALRDALDKHCPEHPENPGYDDSNDDYE